jgi:opacity protein-like surface antigen
VTFQIGKELKVNGRCLGVVFLIVFVILAAFNGAAWAGGNLNIMYGQKNLDDGDWEPVEDQREYGLMIDFKANDNWPVSIALDLLFSEDDGKNSFGIDVEGETRELNLGIRKYFPVTAQFKPYIGGGLAYIDAEISGSLGSFSASDRDSQVGFWLNGGVVFTFAERINIGADLRYSDAEVSMHGGNGEAGGIHVLVFTGVHF